ncbi:TIGR04222 domain-containing membrane protein [Hyalangium sp.]|uniref:TIGR04222 domain-containing membrane protein n=1 Tax=Hyalangium sp. TaxID=2028555 RepID=UPI002D4EB6A7|nr:TIGR04222 domain-containing membrane protein [Hyalangium sp.]HYH94701.1 TIGR04222 domain-containing membrane protein [Hyalangium sp.]
MNPLDWQGPEFLSLYALLLAGGFLVALWVRHLLRLPAGEPLDLGRRQDPYEVAALDGPDTLIEAVVAALFHRNALRIEGRRIATGDTLPEDALPIERSVFECAAAGNVTLEELRRALSPDIENYRRRLAKKGLVLDEFRAAPARLLPSLAYGSFLLLGVAKVLVGLSRDRPVLFLVLIVAFGSLGFLVLGSRPWRTRLGDTTLKLLREEHEALRTTAMAGDSTRVLKPQELALAVGLYGPAMMIPLGYADLRQSLRPSSSSGSGGDSSGGGDVSSCGGDSGGSSSSSSCSSSSCSSSSCSSGSSGCGGCGGGGGD